jgi:hypothetical protein
MSLPDPKPESRTSKSYDEQRTRLWEGFKLSFYRVLYIIGFTGGTLVMIGCDLLILLSILQSIDYIGQRTKENYEFFGFNVHQILYHIEVTTLIVFAVILAFKVLRHVVLSAMRNE